MGKKIIVTHSGGFHADDVFAVATLHLAAGKENIEVVRSRDPKVIETGDFVVDVGFKYDPGKNLFDHHQEGGAGKRKNGIPYASFGLVWNRFGKELCGSEEGALIVDKRLVQPIDANDEGFSIFEELIPGVRPYTISDAIFSFKPSWGEKNIQFDQMFTKAVSIAISILEREITVAQGEIKMDVVVKKAYSMAKDKRLIIVDSSLVGERATVFLNRFPEPIYVAMPLAEDPNWKVRAVYEIGGSYVNRRPFPKEWAGKTGRELQMVTGVSDARFCHNKRFICVAESKVGALALAQKALETSE